MSSNCIYILAYCFFYQPHFLTNLFILKWDICCRNVYNTLIRDFPEYLHEYLE